MHRVRVIAFLIAFLPATLLGGLLEGQQKPSETASGLSDRAITTVPGYKDLIFRVQNVIVTGGAVFEHGHGVLISQSRIRFTESYRGMTTCPSTVDFVGGFCEFGPGAVFVGGGADSFSPPPGIQYRFSFISVSGGYIDGSLFDTRWSSSFNTAVSNDVARIARLAQTDVPQTAPAAADAAYRDLRLKSDWHRGRGDVGSAAQSTNLHHPDSRVSVTISVVFAPPGVSPPNIPCRPYYVPQLFEDDPQHYQPFPGTVPSSLSLDVGAYDFWVQCGSLKSKMLPQDVSQQTGNLGAVDSFPVQVVVLLSRGS